MKRPAEAILNDSVADHCRRDFVTLTLDWTVAEALTHLRENPPPSRVIYFYVTDADGKLLGVVPTRRLLLSPPDRTIGKVMIAHVVAIPDMATVLEACEFFTMHRFLAFPVVDKDRRMIGLIDVELYTDELAELGDEPASSGNVNRDDVFQLVGVHLTAAEQGRPVRAMAGRFPWLLCNLGAGLAAAFLSGVFADVLTWKDAALALFIPVVLALAESVTIQSVTLTLERLHTQRATWGQLLKRGLTESATGGLLGASTAGIIAGAAAVWLQDIRVAAVLLLAIGLGVTVSAVIGFAVPSLLHLFRKNPRVAAGPVCLAASDLLTLLIYFNLARLLR